MSKLVVACPFLLFGPAPYNDSFVSILFFIPIIINKSIVKVTFYTGFVFSLAWVIEVT